MRIKEIKLNKFKRFTDLTISGIPATAKLVILVGPNGSGKTSVFEGMNHWYKYNGFHTYGDMTFYVTRSGQKPYCSTATSIALSLEIGVGSSNSNSSWLMAAGTAPYCSNQYLAAAIRSGVSGQSFQFPKGR